MVNTADLGITTQKLICDKFSLTLHPNAVNQFAANFNPDYQEALLPLIDQIFKTIGIKPKTCLTYAPSSNKREKTSPHNFELENGQTLSIKTNKTGDKAAPRLIGQAGYATFNEFFGHLSNAPISSQEQIKELVFEKVEQMIPLFLDYFFLSDYTVWIYPENDSYNYLIFDRNQIVDIATDRDSFSFTRDLETWTESTTLKYNGTSIAEIQVHKNRTFKFRFILKALMKFIKEQKLTTETFGITAEKAICDMFNIEVPENYKGRYSNIIQKQMVPTIQEAFKHLPKAIRSTGAEQGERGANSKCSYDFVLEGEKTMSLKTTINGSMICPPEVGQPGARTCYVYFGHLVEETIITESNFKQMVLENVANMLPIYLNHLLDSDYLLWIYKKKDIYNYKIFDANFAKSMVWNPNKFSFSKPSILDWNESNTLKYDGVTIGEFQVHKARSSFKFRFNMMNLEKVINAHKNNN